MGKRHKNRQRSWSPSAPAHLDTPRRATETPSLYPPVLTRIPRTYFTIFILQNQTVNRIGIQNWGYTEHDDTAPGYWYTPKMTVKCEYTEVWVTDYNYQKWKLIFQTFEWTCRSNVVLLSLLGDDRSGRVSTARVHRRRHLKRRFHLGRRQEFQTVGYHHLVVLRQPHRPRRNLPCDFTNTRCDKMRNRIII